MIKIKFILILVIIFSINKIANSNVIEIKVKVNNEIITNIDIDNEKKYLIFLNPKLIELDNKRIEKISKDSLITEIIKKNELKKFYDFDKNQNIINNIEKKILKNKNLENKSAFIKILKINNLDYKIIRNKLQVEALWNQFIFKNYINNIKINEEELRKGILDQYNNRNIIYEYNLSEIVFKESLNTSMKEELNNIKENINDIGFENTANIYSIANTSKNGGLIGWVNELQLSKIINNEIKNLDIGQVSKPIKIQSGYILIKLNNKKEFDQKFNLDEQLKRLINEESNRQLNNFSIIFYKKLKKNIKINEY